MFSYLQVPLFLSAILLCIFIFHVSSSISIQRPTKFHHVEPIPPIGMRRSSSMAKDQNKKRPLHQLNESWENIVITRKQLKYERHHRIRRQVSLKNELNKDILRNLDNTPVDRMSRVKLANNVAINAGDTKHWESDSDDWKLNAIHKESSIQKSTISQKSVPASANSILQSKTISIRSNSNLPSVYVMSGPRSKYAVLHLVPPTGTELIEDQNIDDQQYLVSCNNSNKKSGLEKGTGLAIIFVEFDVSDGDYATYETTLETEDY